MADKTGGVSTGPVVNRPVSTGTGPPVNPPVNTGTSAQVNPPTNIGTSAQVNPPTNIGTSAPVNRPTNTGTSAQVNPPTNTGTSAQVNSPTNIGTSAPVNPPTNTGTSAPVNPPTNTRTSAQVNPPTNTGTSAQVNPPTHTGTSAQVNPPTNIGTSAQVNPPIHTGTRAQVNPPTHTGTSAQVNPPTNIGTSAQVNPPTNIGTSAQVNPPTNIGTTTSAQVNPPTNTGTSAQVNPPTITGTSASSTSNATSAPVKRVDPVPSKSDEVGIKLCSIQLLYSDGVKILGSVAGISLSLSILFSLGAFPAEAPRGPRPFTNPSPILAANLEGTYVRLVEKMVLLNKSVLHNISKLTEYAADNPEHINNTKDAIDKHLSQYRASLLQQLRQVKNTVVNPKGSRGNATNEQADKCEEMVLKKSAHSTDNECYSDWYPTNLQEHKAWMITGIECTIEGGVVSMLQTKNLSDMVQFRCVCRKWNASAVQHSCIAIIWKCPV